MSVKATIVWLRQDLRLSDHAALAAAIRRGGPVLPVYLWCPDEEAAWAPGAASCWWLDGSLRALDASLRARGSRLLLRRGASALPLLRELLKESAADAVYWSRRYEPACIARDAGLKSALRADGIEAESFCSALLFEPWENGKDDGTPYKVFTPFWKAMLRRGKVPEPIAAPAAIPAPSSWPASASVDDLELLPRIDWAGGMREAWKPGEEAARAAFEDFLHSGVARYETRRDLPAEDGSSRLSPHLHFGEISPREIWHAVRDRAAERGDAAFDVAAECWLRQLGWRDFGHHLLFHFPHTPERPLRPEFERFAWSDDAAGLRAWTKGLTGYPIVDAGMRQLWATGWMHNRVRMIVASFLVKDLRIAWQQGEKWFWDTLVDADLANNTLGWQWTSGCGADAAPYFRVFNPLLQSRKFDPKGEYLRRWVPEIAGLDDKHIHAPQLAPPMALAAAGLEIGRDYPAPIVEHDRAKRLALEAYAALGSG